VTCLQCPTGAVCASDGTCCTPITCQGQVGQIPDGCGGTIYCGPPK
jgi:hypothetical protein